MPKAGELLQILFLAGLKPKQEFLDDALTKFVEAKNVSLVKQLLDHGAATNFIDQYGYNALMIASAHPFFILSSISLSAIEVAVFLEEARRTVRLMGSCLPGE